MSRGEQDDPREIGRDGAVALLLLRRPPPGGGAQTAVRDKVRAYSVAHEKEIVGELADLLALPNVATKVADVERNADHLTAMLQRRGFAVQRLSAGYGHAARALRRAQRPGGEAHRGVLRPLRRPARGPEGVALRSLQTGDPHRPPGRGVKEVDLAAAKAPLDPGVAALRPLGERRQVAHRRPAGGPRRPEAAGVKPSVNVELFLEGEEEQGSAHLTEILRQ